MDKTATRGLYIASVSLTGETVVKNDGDVSVNLQGYRLHSVTGDQWYDFPSYQLGVGESVTVYSGKGSGDLKWSGAYIWNNDGDPAELYDGSGVLLDTH